jgi:hypothetical protein
MSFMWPSCHQGEEYRSFLVVPCPPPCSEETRKPSASSKVVDDGLDNDDPFFSVKRLVAFFHTVAALSLTNIYPGFSTDN